MHADLPPSVTSLTLDVAFASERLHARWRNELGISAYEMLAISHLSHQGRMTIGELGTSLALTSGAMTGLVDRLEETNRVQRVRDPLDRRRVNLEATATMRDEIARLEQPLREAIDHMVDDLGPEASYSELLAGLLNCYQTLVETAK